MRRVLFEVGPVPAELAREWLENSRELVRAVAASPDSGGLRVSGAVLHLLDAYLSTWLAACDGGAATFRWSADITVDDVQVLAEHWTKLASLTDAQCEQLGWSWAPERTAPVYDAFVAAVVQALREHPATAPYGDELESRPPGSRDG